MSAPCAAESGHLPGSDHRWQDCPTYGDDQLCPDCAGYGVVSATLAVPVPGRPGVTTRQRRQVTCHRCTGKREISEPWSDDHGRKL